jgi:hypothetical protein
MYICINYTTFHLCITRLTYLHSSKHGLVNWLQYCNLVPPKTSNNTNSCHKTLISWVLAPISHSKATVQCVEEFLSFQLLYFPIFRRINKKSTRRKWKMYVSYDVRPIILNMRYIEA